MLSKATRTMALIREPCHKRDFRQRQVCPGEEFLHTTHPALHKISVRGKTRRLLEGAGEVMLRLLRNTGEHLKADILLKVRFDIFAHASQGARRQAAANAWADLHSRRRGSFESGWNQPCPKLRKGRVRGARLSSSYNDTLRRLAAATGWRCLGKFIAVCA